MSKMQILKCDTGEILFEHEQEGNTIKDTVEEAVIQGISLSGANLRFADLRGAYLKKADFCGARMDGADLRYSICEHANFQDAFLSESNFSHAVIFGSVLQGAKLRGANFEHANLEYTNLQDANLESVHFEFARLNYADLKGVNIKHAIFYGSILKRTKNIPYIPLSCPSDGSFIAWKKVCECLVKLEIPEDARRISANINACRCDKAKVLDIIRLDTGEHIKNVINVFFNQITKYEVGEMVYPDWFDDNRWNEYSHGIYFFINKEEAIRYR